MALLSKPSQVVADSYLDANNIIAMATSPGGHTIMEGKNLPLSPTHTALSDVI